MKRQYYRAENIDNNIKRAKSELTKHKVSRLLDIQKAERKSVSCAFKRNKQKI